MTTVPPPPRENALPEAPMEIEGMKGINCMIPVLVSIGIALVGISCATKHDTGPDTAIADVTAKSLHEAYVALVEVENNPVLGELLKENTSRTEGGRFWNEFGRFAYLHGILQAKRTVRPIIKRNYVTTALVSSSGARYYTRDEIMELFESSEFGPTDHFKSLFGDPVDWERVWAARGPTRIWRN